MYMKAHYFTQKGHEKCYICQGKSKKSRETLGREPLLGAQRSNSSDQSIYMYMYEVCIIHCHVLAEVPFIPCRQGKLFHVEVMSPDGRVLPPQGIKRQLERVLEMAGGQFHPLLQPLCAIPFPSRPWPDNAFLPLFRCR